MGISFSGQLCARAAADCIGLDAVVLNPGYWSTQEAWAGGSGSKKAYCQTMELFSLIQNSPDYEQPYIRANINKAFSKDWKHMVRLIDIRYTNAERSLREKNSGKHVWVCL